MNQRIRITRETLAAVIADTIAECHELIQKAGGGNWQLQRDVSEAIRNLKWIQDELEGRVQPRSIPTQAFARFVTDEGEDSRMEMPKELSDYVAEIEYFYLRKVWRKPRWWQFWHSRLAK